MKGYIIKATYLSGPDEGSIYYINNGRRVINVKKVEAGLVGKDDVFNTLRSAKGVCTRYQNINNFKYRLEQEDKEHKRANGKTVKEFNSFELQSYEPFEVSIGETE